MNKLIINDSEFKGFVGKICREITNSRWTPDYVVGITRGGCIPAVMISHYFNCRCEMLHVSLRDGGGCETNCWMSEDATGYNGKPKNILIVDDINDSGATLNWIINDWQGTAYANDTELWKDVWNNNVRFATVVDNLSSDAIVKVDYVGMEVNKAENDVWIEFPYENWWTK